MPSAVKDNHPLVLGEEYHYQSMDFVCFYNQGGCADNLLDTVEQLLIHFSNNTYGKKEKVFTG